MREESFHLSRQRQLLEMVSTCFYTYLSLLKPVVEVELNHQRYLVVGVELNHQRYLVVGVELNR
jgi:hypothetical protein